jgi:hypothetical protein
MTELQEAGAASFDAALYVLSNVKTLWIGEDGSECAGEAS